MVHLSRYMACLRVSPTRGVSSPIPRRSHLSSPLGCRICCLFTFAHLQTARFPRRCPETGENSTASELSFTLVTANAVYSLGHRWRPYLNATVASVVACVGSFSRENQPRSDGRRGQAEHSKHPQPPSGQSRVYRVKLLLTDGDHEQDWQPYPVDPYSAICDGHTYIHTYIHTDESSPAQEKYSRNGRASRI